MQQNELHTFWHNINQVMIQIDEIAVAARNNPRITKHLKNQGCAEGENPIQWVLAYITKAFEFDEK